jgi:fermentation-respiration switch protein FrsA (DUF1100 family)
MLFQRFIIAIAILSVIVFAYIHWMKKKMLFYPTKEDTNYRPNNYHEFFLDENGNDVHYPFDNTISGWYIDNHAKKTFLYCHGNAGNITHRDYIIELSKDLNYNLVLFDYSGFGKSRGEPSLHKILEEGERVYKYVTSLVDPKDLVIWGESMGGAVAIHLASNYKCSKLILIGTFSSLDDVLSNYDSFKYKIMGTFAGFFVNTMRNKDKMSNINVPIAIVHSVNDEVVPYSCAHELYKSINHINKILINISGPHSRPNISTESIEKLLSFLNVSELDPKKISNFAYLINTVVERYNIK